MSRLREEEGRLRLASYARTIEMRVSYADLDSFGRLSAGAVARFFEEGRTATVVELFGVAAAVRPDSPVQVRLDSLVVEHLADGRYPGFVTIATGVSSLDGARLGHSAAIFQGAKLLAVCEAVSVRLQEGREAPAQDVGETLEKLRYRG